LIGRRVALRGPQGADADQPWPPPSILLSPRSTTMDIEACRLTRVLESWSSPFPGYHLYYPSRRDQSPAFTLLAEAQRYRP
jgi:hypothetical protein